jgi:FSR family fosmidomycin resistance protein-like MFS transporter
MVALWLRRYTSYTALFVFALLLVEFVDEFVFGLREAAWPLIRTDLHLSYEQVGIILGVPHLFGNLIEMVLGILADVWKRRIIVLGGGVVFVLAALLLATSQTFIAFLLVTILFFPASGAFVGLSQSTLMDVNPARHEQQMARWVLAGSVGVLVGSAALGLFPDWRALFTASAFLAAVALFLLSRFRFPAQPSPAATNLREGLHNALRAIRRREVLRWLVLLECADLMGDILLGYMALYFVDVVGVTQNQAAFAVGLWTAVSLVGDFLLIPLLERVRGLAYLRVSAWIVLILFPIFLIVPGWLPKLILLVLVGISNTGWYSILMGQLYSAMPGQSGTVLTISNIFQMLAGLAPLAIGMVAERLGLSVAIWLLLLGPIVLIVGLPRLKSQIETPVAEGE